MARVAALYRYPVKGFSPEVCESLDVQEDGRIQGDRVLGFRFASTPEPDDAWSSKHGMLALVNTPGLARLEMRFDESTQHLSLRLDDAVLVEDALTAEGRSRICRALEEFVLGLPINPLANRPDHLPLRLVGDGHSALHQDSNLGRVSLHGRASLASVAAAFGDDTFDEVRFRSNIAVEGTAPWEEQGWTGRGLRVGTVAFEVAKPMVRCLATHANPQTGERDRDLLRMLPSLYGGGDPTFAIALEALEAGRLAIGDAVEVSD